MFVFTVSIVVSILSHFSVIKCVFMFMCTTYLVTDGLTRSFLTAIVCCYRGGASVPVMSDECVK